MNNRENLSWHIVKILVVIIMISLSLGGCTNNNTNIDSNQANLATDGSNKLNDHYYTIALGNMVNLDNAYKHKLDKVFYTVSNIQIKYGQYEQALETVNRGLEFSNDILLVTNKVDLLNRKGDFASRNTVVEAFVDENFDLYTNMSLDEKMSFNYFLVSNDYNELAIQNYLDILEWSNDYSILGTIYNNIGWAYLNLNDFETAQTYCETAIEYAPEDSTMLSNLGNCYYGLQDYEKALLMFDKAIKYNPNNTDAIYKFGTVANELQKYNLAIDFWPKYVTLLPSNIEGWTGYYVSAAAIEDWNTVKNCLDAMVSLAPDEWDYAYAQLIVQQKLGTLTDPYEVITSYQEAAGVFNANWLVADFTYNYISTENGLMLYETMLTDTTLSYSQYTALAERINALGEGTLLSNVLSAVEEYFNREDRLKIEAYLYYTDKDVENLFEVSTEIIEINPESGYGYEYLGDAYYFKEDFETAALNYELATLYSDDKYYSRKAYVDCMILLDRTEEAEQLSKKFLKDYPYDAWGYVNHARIKMKMWVVESAVKHLVTAMSLSNDLGGIFETYEELASLKDRPEFKSLNQ